jgi:hypothetical protein
MSEITVKVGNVSLTASNNDLVSVDETPDGVSFSFKGGLQLLFTDPYMPSSAKQIIKNTADNMSGKLVFELDNAKRPARVEAV